MLAFLVKRLAGGFLTLFCIATICFFIMRLAPGSPFAGEKTLSPVVLGRMNEKYALDKPLHVQYGHAMLGYLKGDLGVSYKYDGFTVNELIAPRLGRSLQLGAI